MVYHGLEVMGGGSILAGLVLGAIGVFIIERDFLKASAFAFAGAVMTYFGFMHGEAVGIGGGFGVTPAWRSPIWSWPAACSGWRNRRQARATARIRKCRSQRRRSETPPVASWFEARGGAALLTTFLLRPVLA